MQAQIKTLLNDITFKIGTLRKANELFSDRLAPNFSIFDYLRTDEMGLSRCIASLLDPSGKHGQGCLFLQSFLKLIDKSLPEPLSMSWESVPTNNCQVSLERQANGQRRIDIYLKFKNGAVLGIENKPWASDQENQLKDYADFIQKEAGDERWALLYLCNNDPSTSDYSIKKDDRKRLERKGNFVWLDYAEVIEWLESCARYSRAPVVKIFTEELAKFIRIEINGELDMSEEKEIKNVVLESTKNLESAFHISKAIKSIKEELLGNFYDDLTEMLKKKDFELVWDDSMYRGWKSYSGFGVRFNDTQNFYLRFEFASSGLHDLYWGIRRENESIKRNTDIWNEINLKMDKKFGSGGKTEWWPWWSWIDNNQELGSDFRHWDSSEKPWVSMVSSQSEPSDLAKKVTNSASAVRAVFSRNMDLLSK